MRIIKFGKYYGWADLWRRLFLFSAKWLIEKRSFTILILRPQDVPLPDLRLTFKEIKQADIDEIFRVMYFSREHITERFDRGEKCFAILEKGHVVTYLWAAFGERNIKEVFMSVKIKPTQSWFYNALTVKDARGKGYYPNLIRFMAKTLQEEGIDEVFIDVEDENTASVHGIEKAGFKKVSVVRMKKLFYHINYHITVFDAPVWSRLSEEIECL